MTGVKKKYRGSGFTLKALSLRPKNWLYIVSAYRMMRPIWTSPASLGQACYCRSSRVDPASSKRFELAWATADKSRHRAWIALICHATRKIAPVLNPQSALRPIHPTRRVADWEKRSEEHT